MTRKDYVRLATALKAAKPAEHWDVCTHEQWHSDCHRIAQALGEDNPRFDYQRFYDACGWPERYATTGAHCLVASCSRDV
jgi:hypothetical protein